MAKRHSKKGGKRRHRRSSTKLLGGFSKGWAK